VIRLKLKRAYEPAEQGDGARFLVERLWPRGVSKEAARLDGWLKEAAPSEGLRKWYGHDPAKWPEFRRRYLAELARDPEALEPLREAARQGPVTLVFAARDPQLSNARILKELLERRPLERQPRRRSALSSS
jgi:uncharacterized protein YeaO (DUF488 family)